MESMGSKLSKPGLRMFLRPLDQNLESQVAPSFFAKNCQNWRKLGCKISSKLVHMVIDRMSGSKNLPDHQDNAIHKNNESACMGHESVLISEKTNSIRI